LAEEVPGFFVEGVGVGAAVAFSAKEEAGTAEDVGERDDVPAIFGNDESGEEVDFLQGVGDGFAVGAAVSVEVPESIEKLGGAFDLDAREEVAGVGDEVVSVGVAEGLGDAEAEVERLVEEGDFGEFSTALGGEFVVLGSFEPGRIEKKEGRAGFGGGLGRKVTGGMRVGRGSGATLETSAGGALATGHE
jgi:hypothetical protein